MKVQIQFIIRYDEHELWIKTTRDLDCPAIPNRLDRLIMFDNECKILFVSWDVDLNQTEIQVESPFTAPSTFEEFKEQLMLFVTDSRFTFNENNSTSLALALFGKGKL